VTGERKFKVGAHCWINDRSSRPSRPCCKIQRSAILRQGCDCSSGMSKSLVLSLDAGAEAGCGASRKLLSGDFEAVFVLTLLRLAFKGRK
jgi:hypothetical protein